MSQRVMTDPRISRRRRAVARSKRRRVMVTLSVILALAAGLWGAFLSPLLRVREVKLVGAKHTTASEVQRVAGLGPEDNLLLLSPDLVAAKAETLPWVKSAEVDRMLPDTVRVRIEERVPAIVLSLGAARWTMDSTGHVLAPGEAGENLPVLAGVEVGGVRPGLRLVAEEATQALRAWRALPRALQTKVVAVFAPTLERISFSLADGLVIRFGAAEKMDAKNEVLRAILARVRSQGRTIAYVDVRVPTNPAVLPHAPVAVAAVIATPTPTPTPEPTATPTAAGESADGKRTGGD